MIVFGKQLSSLIWIIIMVICYGILMLLRVFLITSIVLNLQTLLGLGMFIEKEPVKRYMVNHFLILGICNVFGILVIETSGQRPRIILIMRIGLKEVLCILPGSKLFEELVLDFDISRYDRGKFNFLMNCIPSSWLRDSNSKSVDIFDSITSHLVDVQKVRRFAYSMLTETCVPENRIEFWEKLINMNADEDGPEETDWEEIHLRNFKCCIETKLRSFYFKIFHTAIAFNDFLFKINRKDSDLWFL